MDTLPSLTRRQLCRFGCGSAAAIACPVLAAAHPWRVGQVASLSGHQGADLGLGLKLGIEAAFAAANARGGLQGRPLQLVSLDDRYQPEETVRLTKELLQRDSPVALIGYRGTANTLALVRSRLLEQAGVTLVGTLTGAHELQGARQILHLRTSYERELLQLAAQMQSMMIQHIGVLYADDAFGHAGLQAVQRGCGAAKVNLVQAVAYDGRPAAMAESISAAAKKLAGAGVQGLVLVAVGEPVYSFIRTFRPLAPAVRLFCMSVVDPAAVVRTVGPELATGVGFSQVFPFPHSLRWPLVRDYRQALAALPGDNSPSYFSLEGYVYARVLIEALRRNRDAVDAVDAISVGRTLMQLPALDLGGLQLLMDPATRNASSYTDLTVIGREGRLVR